MPADEQVTLQLAPADSAVYQPSSLRGKFMPVVHLDNYLITRNLRTVDENKGQIRPNKFT